MKGVAMSRGNGEDTYSARCHKWGGLKMFPRLCVAWRRETVLPKSDNCRSAESAFELDRPTGSDKAVRRTVVVANCMYEALVSCLFAK